MNNITDNKILKQFIIDYNTHSIDNNTLLLKYNKYFKNINKLHEYYNNLISELDYKIKK